MQKPNRTTLNHNELMARANRHHLPGYVWHITHRCHKKEFLLKFGRDRSRWLHWLFEAKKRYGLTILNYNEIMKSPERYTLISRHDLQAFSQAKACGYQFRGFCSRANFASKSGGLCGPTPLPHGVAKSD